MAKKKLRKKILTQDLVIKKGTIFEEIPYGSKTSYGEDNFEAIFGLSKNTSGTIVYCFDDGVAGRERGKLNRIFKEIND